MPSPPDADLEALLRDAGRRVEPEIQRRLQGLLGSFVRAYLPQAWVFRTDVGTATLLVDARGATSVVAEPPAHPDVTVEATFARLSAALREGRKGAPSSAGVTVTTHTSKGKAAFDYLRERVGL